MTVKRVESTAGVIGGTVESALRIQKALEQAGIIFIAPDFQGGPGVRLDKPRSR
jgi:hypothetical protein